MNNLYAGPNPKEINENFPDHTDEYITCLLTGQQLRFIRKDRFKKLGFTLEEYLKKYHGAPLMSNAAKKSRSKNLTKLNASDEFKSKKITGRKEFFKTEEGALERARMSAQAKKQHEETDLEDKIRKYFNEDFIGSDDQAKRSIRLTEFNNNQPDEIKNKRVLSMRDTLDNDLTRFRKKKYKNYNLFYQSSFEFRFLKECERLNIIQFVENCKSMKDDLYPRSYYLPDFKIFNEYIVEVKSWYIEKIQEEQQNTFIHEKRDLVLRLGFKWLYVLDNDFAELRALAKSHFFL